MPANTAPQAPPCRLSFLSASQAAPDCLKWGAFPPNPLFVAVAPPRFAPGGALSRPKKPAKSNKTPKASFRSRACKARRSALSGRSGPAVFPFSRALFPFTWCLQLRCAASQALQSLPLQLVSEGVFFLFSGFSFFSGLRPWGWSCSVGLVLVLWWCLLLAWVVCRWWLLRGAGWSVLRWRLVRGAGGFVHPGAHFLAWCWWRASPAAALLWRSLALGAAGAAVLWRCAAGCPVAGRCGWCRFQCISPARLRLCPLVAVSCGGFPVGSGVVAIVGSRQLPPGGGVLVVRVAGALVGSGYGLVVGCATGADAAVLTSVPSSLVLCLSAFGRGGAGACGASAVQQVRAHHAAGGAVQWWAGGPASVPLPARLRARTGAVVAAASSGLVAFLSSPSSRGSALACRLAAARGLPVVAFPLGFHGQQLPALGAGQWVPCQQGGVWAAAWQWQAQTGLGL